MVQYEGVLVPLTCETCGSAMHVCRRPYEAGGLTYRYWALYMPAVPYLSYAPEQLSERYRY